MFQLPLTVRPGTNLYLSQPCALNSLDDIIAPFRYPLIVSGPKAYQAFERYYTGKLKNNPLFYDRTGSHENIESLIGECPPQTDILIGIGGGVLLDTVKAMAHRLQIDYIAVPTVLGTCAANTPLSVIYDLNHQFKCIEYYPKSAYAVLCDHQLLITSPQDYFMGGMGDTLAKWYEASAITQHLEVPYPAPVDLGLSSAQLTKTILLRDGFNALKAMKENQITPSFQRVVDTILLLSACVGGFAVDKGRISGAHAIHNGMSLLSETHPYQHGIKVAFGILVQLLTLNQKEEVENLLPFYKENGFLTKLSQFSIQDNLHEKAVQIAEFAASSTESYQLAKPDIRPQDIVSAILQLEDM